MKIMVVNNTVLFERNGGLYIYKETGKFFYELKQLGFEVIVFQYRMQTNGNDTFASYDLKNKGFLFSTVKRGKNKLWAYTKAFFKGFLTVKKADFVYIFYPGIICIVLAVFCMILNKRFGLYVRGEQGIMSTVSKFIYKKATVVFTISPKFTEIIKDIGGNAYTIRPMMDVSEKDIVYNRIYKKKDSYSLLYVGRIVHDKGIFDLVDAIENLVIKKIKNLTLHLVGDGDDLLLLRQKIEKSKLKEYIILHGKITDKESLIRFYKESDLFVFPSHHEGFPRVLYEAMVFGIPIITTFVGGIPYIMKDHYNCRKIEPKNVADITLVIENFIKHYENQSIIAKNGTSTIIGYLADKKEPHAHQLEKIINKKNY